MIDCERASNTEAIKVIKKKHYGISLIKVIAIIMVVAYHTNILNCDILNNKNIIVYIKYTVKSLLSCCVPLFFLVNGALLLNKELNIKKHIKKIIKIIIITEIWAVVITILTMLAKDQVLNYKEIFYTIWFWKMGYVNFLWFLAALVVIYILFPIIKQCFDNNEKYFIFFLISVLICTFGNKLIYMIVNLLKPSFLYGETNFINIYNPFRGIYGYSIGYFMLGGLLFKYKDKIRRPKKIILVILLIMSTILLSIYGILKTEISQELYDTVWNGYDSIFTLINVIIIFSLVIDFVVKDNILSKYISLIDENTLGIYVIHPILLVFLDKIYYSKISVNIMSLVIYTFIIFNISLIICTIGKKIPIIKNLFKI